MGNEMGNNNVSGIQEQENIKVEAPNTHSDVSISAGDEIAETKPVSSTKEEGFHEKQTGLSSENLPHVEKESSDGREKTEVQAYDVKTSETPLSPNVMKDHEMQSADDTTSSADGCLDDSYDGMQKSPVLTNGTEEQETESTLLAQGECADDTDHQTQKQIMNEKEGEEIESSPLDTEDSPQDPESTESVYTLAEPSQEYRSNLEETNEAIPATNGPRDTEAKEQKLEEELSNDLETNAFSANMSKTDDSTIETPNEVDGELNGDAKEDGTDEQLQELNLLSENPAEQETEVTSLAESQEASQGETTELETDLILPTAETKLAEKIVEIEQRECKVDTSFGSQIKMKSQSADAKATDNGYQVGFHKRRHSLACEETVMDLEKETVTVSELPIESTAVTNIEGDECPTGHLYLCQPNEKAAAEDKERDNEETGKVMNSIPSYFAEPAEYYVPTSPTSLDHVQDGRQNLPLLESQMQDNLRSLMLESNQESFSKVEVTTGSTHDLELLTVETSTQLEGFERSMGQHQVNKHAQHHDSKTGITTLKDNDIFDTGSNQEVIKSPIVDAEDQSKQSGNQDSEHNPLSNKKVTDELNGEHINNNAHVTEAPSLLLFDAPSGDSDRSPPLVHPEKTLAHDLSNGKLIEETDFAALEPLNCHEPAEEKQVITLETTDPENLKGPLLNFSKEEDHIGDLPKKQEGLTAKMDEEEKWSSLTINTKHPKKEKRKPRYSLFSNCICCTTVTP